MLDVFISKFASFSIISLTPVLLACSVIDDESSRPSKLSAGGMSSTLATVSCNGAGSSLSGVKGGKASKKLKFSKLFSSVMSCSVSSIISKGASGEGSLSRILKVQLIPLRRIERSQWISGSDLVGSSMYPENALKYSLKII